MISVCTSSTGTQLTTLEALKAILRTTSTGTDDLLSSYISRASNAVQEYLGYPIYRQVYRETVAAYGDNQLMLSRTPVLAIESITDSDGNQLESTGYNIEDQDAGLVWRDEGFPWSAAVMFELDPRPVPGSEKREYVAVYEAGYTLTCATSTGGYVTATTGRTIPEWAELATLETAKSWFKRSAADGAVQSKRIGDLSISYGNASAGQALFELPSTAIALLRSHARSV